LNGLAYPTTAVEGGSVRVVDEFDDMGLPPMKTILSGMCR
jgi:hypothetical protein